MAPPSRRDLLHASSLAITTALAGCPGNTATDTNTSQTAAPTNTPTQSTATEDNDQSWTGGDNWPMLHVDAANTSHHPSTTGPTDPVTERWQFESGKTLDTPSYRQAPPAFETAPAVVDGTVYVTTTDGLIYAIDERDGSEIWQFDTGKQGLGAPVVAEGLVHAVAGGHRIHTVDAATGEPQWRFEPEGQPQDSVWSSLTVADGTLYVALTDSELFAIDAQTGTKQWNHRNKRARPGTPAVVDDTVYFTIPGRLYALDATDGTERWQYPPEKDSRTVGIGGDPLVTNGSVFVGIHVDNPNVTHTASGRVAALQPGDGTVQWQVDTNDPVSPIATDGNTLYVATNSPGHAAEGSLLALDPSDGAERWRRDSDQHNYGWIEVVDETLYVRTYGNMNDPIHLRAIQTADGTEHWADKFPEERWSRAAVVNGTVYVSEPHTIYALQ